MNSKELLVQADKRIAEVEQIKFVKCNIADLERLIKLSQDDKYDLRYFGEHCLSLKESLDVNDYEGLKTILSKYFAERFTVQIINLEKILGITPKIINPEFEAAVRSMEQPENLHTPDSVEDKLSVILQRESKQINTKPIPPIMTVDLVRNLYHDKGMTLDAVAKVFEVNSSALYRFVVANNLRKPSKRDKEIFQDSQAKPRGKEPETECPTDTKEF